VAGGVDARPGGGHHGVGVHGPSDGGVGAGFVDGGACRVGEEPVRKAVESGYHPVDGRDGTAWIHRPEPTVVTGRAARPEP